MNEILAKFAVIDGERIMLRPVKVSDAEAMFAYTSKPEVVKFITLLVSESVEQTRKGIADYFEVAPLGKYGLALKSSGAFMGTLDIRVDEENKSAEIGYALNPEFQGHGYMSEAVDLLLSLGFKELGLERMFAMCAAQNTPSERVMIRAGMTYEGTLRKASFHKDMFLDMKYYSILKDEYFAAK
ncbi:GNAT family N-acetyltransferase [Culicoidibacter larvae]|uniref:GNAT family N-acetyltransferase n=1 Tax=Culicoidibacter larvae TaxID=2579976 RepID=A0A5R8QH76_9FIRM|nr:GNAT family protein [Culicoidibacter larvae]TLG77389.1 GNAT family N-acetyltransferase [Culicoidibacter larvae]